jgi:hypothetical protein
MACLANLRQMMLLHTQYDSDFNAFAKNTLSARIEGSVIAAPHWMLLAENGYMPKRPASVAWVWTPYGIARCPAGKSATNSYGYGMNDAQSASSLDGVSAPFSSFRQIRNSQFFSRRQPVGNLKIFDC